MVLCIVFAVLTFLALPAMAETRLDAAGFDAAVTGRTIVFRTATNPVFGVEAYLPGRRVIWSAFDGTCSTGRWFPRDQDICFLYDDLAEPQCWAIFATPSGLRGAFTNVPEGTVIFETDLQKPLVCNDLSS